MPHFTIKQAGLVVMIQQIVGYLVSFGVLNNTAAGTVIGLGTAAVGFAFLVANSIHALGHAQVNAPVAVVTQTVAAPAIPVRRAKAIPASTAADVTEGQPPPSP